MSQDSSLALSSPREPQSEEKPQKSLIEKQQVDILFRSSSFFMLIIFSGAGKPRPANQVYFTRSRILWGWPIAAYLIYKSLLQWRSFEVERTNVFDRIIQTIGAAIEGLRASP
ncbi:hypothetical protein AAG906_023567 [Vitis piasezkii]